MELGRNLRIAVTDRNPHVREFLCRELARLGFPVRPLAGAEGIFASFSGPEPPQVLVLDPEAAGGRLNELARKLAEAPERVAVVLHVFEGAEAPDGFAGAVVVEKSPDMVALEVALTSLAAERRAAEGVS